MLLLLALLATSIAVTASIVTRQWGHGCVTPPHTPMVDCHHQWKTASNSSKMSLMLITEQGHSYEYLRLHRRFEMAPACNIRLKSPPPSPHVVGSLVGSSSNNDVKEQRKYANSRRVAVVLMAIIQSAIPNGGCVPGHAFGEMSG